METQSQEHLNRAGEITSLRNKRRWGQGKGEAVSQAQPAPPLGWGLSISEMGSIRLVAPPSLGGWGDPMVEGPPEGPEEEGDDSTKARNAEATLVIEVLEPPKEDEGLVQLQEL